MNTPDWGFWRQREKLEAWQAILLSLDIDPDEVNPNDSNFDKFFEGNGVAANRLKLLEDSLRDKDYFKAISFAGLPRFSRLRLREFALWVVIAMGWDEVPIELIDIADEDLNNRYGPSVFDKKVSPADDSLRKYGYTIRGAAHEVSQRYGVSESAIRDRIFEATVSGDLKVIDPQTGLPYIPEVRRDFYECIRVDEINRWFNLCGVEYRLIGDDQLHELEKKTLPSDDDQKVSALRFLTQPGVESKELIEHFKLDGVNWFDKLSRPNSAAKAYKSALVQKGRRGRGGGAHTWNPAQFAICLLKNRERKHPTALRSVIANHFPDWLPEFDCLWEEIGRK